MSKHMEIIAAWCKVLDTKDQRAIWYEDDGYKYADVLEEGEGWVSYSCDTAEIWEILTEGTKENSSVRIDKIQERAII